MVLRRMMDKVYLTRAKYNAYLEEIKYMEGEGGQLMAKLLASSPGSGMGRPNDLPVHQMASEFRGYLHEIKNIVNCAVIIDDLRDESTNLEEVVIGCTVVVRYEGDEEVEEYTILGKHEVDPSKGRISCWSPIGSSLLGKRKGDRVVIELSPSREVRMVVEEVKRMSLSFDYPCTNWKCRLELALMGGNSVKPTT